jgi:hypothetical protein
MTPTPTTRSHVTCTGLRPAWMTTFPSEPHMPNRTEATRIRATPPAAAREAGIETAPGIDGGVEGK